MSSEIEKTIREKEFLVGALNSVTYTEIFAAGEDVYANKMIIRNTLPTNRIIIRLDEDDEQIITVEPGGTDQFVFGGMSKLKGKVIEAKLQTSIPESLRVDLFN